MWLTNKALDIAERLYRKQLNMLSQGLTSWGYDGYDPDPVHMHCVCTVIYSNRGNSADFLCVTLWRTWPFEFFHPESARVIAAHFDRHECWSTRPNSSRSSCRRESRKLISEHKRWVLNLWAWAFEHDVSKKCFDVFLCRHDRSHIQRVHHSSTHARSREKGISAVPLVCDRVWGLHTLSQFPHRLMFTSLSEMHLLWSAVRQRNASKLQRRLRRTPRCWYASNWQRTRL